MELEGKEYHEIWPARVELIDSDKKDKDKGDSSKDKSSSEDVLKVVGKSQWHVPDVSISKVQPGVARSDEDLEKLTGNKDAAAAFAKRFKVDSIDWKKQMVVIVGDGQKPTGGFSVSITAFKTDGKTLTVSWKLTKPDPGSIQPQIVTTPGEAALVERFDGDVKFDPPLPKGSSSDK
jgi:hypothetical protein